MIIDIHVHYYSKGLYPNWVPYGIEPLKLWLQTPNIGGLVVSSLDVLDKRMETNNKLTEICINYPKLWQWYTIDPRVPYWWDRLPKSEKILGIKVHPTWQNYELINYLYKILEVAKHNKWSVITHSGVKEPFVDIEKSISIADRYPEVPVIFAHLGSGFKGYKDVLTQVEYLAKTKNENTFIDISSLAIHLSGLLEESVKRIGSSRIIFGTDMPLHLPQSQLSRIINGSLSWEFKEKILNRNASIIFPQLKGDI